MALKYNIGDNYFKDKVGIGVTSPTSPLDVDGDIELSDTLYFTGASKLIDYNTALFIGSDENSGGYLRLLPSSSINYIQSVDSDRTASQNLYITGLNGNAMTLAQLYASTIYLRGDVGIGTSTVPHGSVGWAKLAIDGADSSSDGPHVQFTTASDNYPLMQFNMYSHDNVQIAFDGYYDGGWKSSSSNSNFVIQKASDALNVYATSGKTPGNTMSLSTDDIKFSISDGGVVDAVGTLSSSEGQINSVNDGGDADFYSISYGGTARLEFRQTNGTKSSPTAIATTEGVGVISWYGWDGDEWRRGGYLYGKAQGNFSDSNYSFDLIFGTTNLTSGITPLIIHSDGMIQMSEVYSDSVGGTNRDLYIDDTGKIGYVSSSFRYKTNIHTLTDVEKVYELRPVIFDYKDTNKGVHQLGLIAEEVELLIPELVSYNYVEVDGFERKEAETVHYSKLPVVLLTAIKDLNQRVKELEERT